MGVIRQLAEGRGEPHRRSRRTSAYTPFSLSGRRAGDEVHRRILSTIY